MPQSIEGQDTLERYETILKNIRDGVYTLDPEGRITWVNETAIEEFDIGYDRDELIGASVSMLLTEDDIQKCVDIIQDCLHSDDRDSGRCEVALQTADGDEIPCDLHLALLPMEDGEFRGTVGVVRDVTERKRREQRLEVLNRVLRHNLRNDMNVIIGRAEELKRTDSGGRHVEAILEVGNELLELSEKVRWLSEFQDRIGHSPKPIDVGDLLNRICSEFRTEYSGVEFETDSPDQGDVEAAVGSPEFLDVAVRNVIENAIEHNRSDEPRVSVTARQEGSRAVVRVADNGPGLPEQERAVFETGSETPLQHGSGIGLWLVYWCLEACGGDITFEEQSPTGTVVTMAFPTGDGLAA